MFSRRLVPIGKYTLWFFPSSISSQVLFQTCLSTLANCLTCAYISATLTMPPIAHWIIQRISACEVTPFNHGKQLRESICCALWLCGRTFDLMIKKCLSFFARLVFYSIFMYSCLCEVCPFIQPSVRGANVYMCMLSFLSTLFNLSMNFARKDGMSSCFHLS